ncbi:MAG: xanthine dehydrogenase family protein molybdopterin-binding subunit [Verrucomicrobiota bacterium]
MITFTQAFENSTRHVGQPVSRVDGRAKVTGAASYAGEFAEDGMLYGVVVSSSIAKGNIRGFDLQAALAVSGVVHIFTHENRPDLAWFDRSYRDLIGPAGSPLRPLYDDKIHHSCQPVALVVADTFEAARSAAALLSVKYEESPHQTNLRGNLHTAREPEWKFGRTPPPSPKGNAFEALKACALQVDLEFMAPAEYHNPMEMHASTVLYERKTGHLTVYDKTQGVQNVLGYLTKVFGLSKSKVKVVSPYVGGAFGSGLRPAYNVFLTVMAALELKRSVRVTLTRQQMFSFGHRPSTLQRVAMGSGTDGKLKSLIHEVYAETSRYEDFVETVANWSGVLYPSETHHFQHSLVHLDVPTPMDMRAPGAGWGLYAAECAMDELAAEAGMDPLQLRLANYAEVDPLSGKPFGSKALRACYEQAATRFGWEKRPREPRSMKEGHKLVGWGMATGAWEAMQLFAGARARLDAHGKLGVSSATSDIGTGTYTIMTQIAADVMGLDLEAVTFSLGDSTMPFAPPQGGSFTAVTVGSAVKSACDKLARKLFKLARKMDASPFAGTRFEEVELTGGKLRLRASPQDAVAFTTILQHAGLSELEVKITALPSLKRMRHAHYAHSAVFAEVKVDEDFGTIQVSRVVSAVAAGKILNPKTARSQVLGGIVWGIGMALHEEALMDHHFGRVMNHSFAEYHIPANADVDQIEVIFVEEEDSHVNALGAKGVGEIGLVGVAAAICNAVYHATGRRVRSLPLTLDKIICP